jgi:hypothetical protein
VRSVAKPDLSPIQRRHLAQVSIDAASDVLRKAAEECPELEPHVTAVLAELDRATATLGVGDEVVRSPSEARPLRVPQGPTSGVAALFGQWPGDESDDDFEGAVRDPP